MFQKTSVVCHRIPKRESTTCYGNQNVRKIKNKLASGLIEAESPLKSLQVQGFNLLERFNKTLGQMDDLAAFATQKLNS